MKDLKHVPSKPNNIDLVKADLHNTIIDGAMYYKEIPIDSFTKFELIRILYLTTKE